MPAYPDRVGTVIHRVPIGLCQSRREHRIMLGGMVSRRAISFSRHSYDRVITCLTVSITQLRTTFYMLQAALTLRIFLNKIGSSYAVSSSVFGRKSL